MAKGIEMKSVEIYTTNSCGYCRMAKSLLTRKGVKFHEIDISNDPDMRMAMNERAGGRRTVPQIFIGETHIGGCDDLHALENSGALDTLLGR
jgi:glutaredoxin 3